MNPATEIDINDLCSGFEYMNVTNQTNEINEMEELHEAINYIKNNKFNNCNNIYILNKTVDRYNRYLAEIDIWVISDFECTYLKNMVLKFIDISKQVLTPEIILSGMNLMYHIDGELLRLINMELVS